MDVTGNQSAHMLSHQGWTDIINCLPLINYFSPQYKELTVIMREDAQGLLDFYLKQFSNVNALYVKKAILGSPNVGALLEVDKNDKNLFFGGYDGLRTDIYHKAYSKTSGFFVEKFYTDYGVPYKNRVDSFSFTRDYEAENTIYEKIVKNYEGEYSVVHEDLERGLALNPEGNTKVVKLNGASSIFFDYVKVLENATSIYLIDSVWAALCYLLDAKYGLLQNARVKVYCLRGHQEMFTKPLKLPNWEIN